MTVLLVQGDGSAPKVTLSGPKVTLLSKARGRHPPKVTPRTAGKDRKGAEIRGKVTLAEKRAFASGPGGLIGKPRARRAMPERREGPRA